MLELLGVLSKSDCTLPRSRAPHDESAHTRLPCPLAPPRTPSHLAAPRTPSYTLLLHPHTLLLHPLTTPSHAPCADEPFLKQFDELDRNGDHRLSREDLASAALANQRRASSLVASRAAATRTCFRTKLGGHANDLLVPTFLLSFGFMWNSVWGALLMCAGLTHAVAVGFILGWPVRKRTLRRILFCVAGGALLVLAALCLLFTFLFDQRTYLLYIDRLSYISFFGTLDANSNTHVQLRSDQVDALIAQQISVFHKPPTFILFGLYVCTFLYALAVDFMTAVCCFMLFKDERISE
jgi:hypothetical protein